MKKAKIMAVCLLTTILVSCSNNYSHGKRVGYITQFSKAGLMWESWEGHLNMTQTGNNSAAGFDFSVDNDKFILEEEQPIKNLQVALDSGYKVELTYTAVKGFNVWGNRGNTNYFVSECKILKTK